MNYGNTKALIVFSTLIIIFGLGFLWLGMKPAELSISAPLSATTSAQLKRDGVEVLKVVDGDTIVIEGDITVRFLGIDTPETKDPRRPVGCFGKEASSEVKNLLQGKRVILEKDISETDKYGRLLRYIYLPLEGGQKLFVNDYLVREGFAFVLTYPPDIKYNEQLREAEKAARENKRGLWEKC